ncbi:MAG: acyltransferase [Methylococcaceae bacterium]
MNKALSNYLDIVRVIASFAVLFQHLSMYNNDVFPVFLNYGHLAVMAFFILSGYVIAFVAEQREKTFNTFIKHRLARLYSVMVVAWLLTILLDTTGTLINPQTYENMLPSGNIVVRTFAHIFFLHESWFTSIQFFSNQPLWSLAYEFWYYILFGAIFLYEGKFKALIILAICLVIGPVILLYSLIWFSGAYLYKLHQKEIQIDQTLASAVFLISLPIIFSYPYWDQYLLPADIFTYGKLSLNTFFEDVIFAFFIIINIFFFHYSGLSFHLLSPVIRFFSGISFALYVFHFPLILFFKAILTRYFSLSDSSLFIIISILIVITVYFLSFISERKKAPYYQLFGRIEDLVFKKPLDER